MDGEHVLGLDALNDDLSINLDGDLIEEGLPEFKPNEGLESNKDEIITKIPGEETKDGLPSSLENVAKEDDSSKTPEEVSNSSPGLSKIYSSLATHLSKEGVLPSLSEDTDVTDVDKLADAINAEITSRVGTLEQEYKKAMEDGVPKDEFVNYQKVASQLNGISPEMLQEDGDKATLLRTNIIAQDFINRGFDREEALKYAKRSVDLGEDSADASTSLARLKEHNSTSYNTAVQKTKDAETKVHDDITKLVNSTDEVIKGIKIGAKTKEDLIKQIITPVGNDKAGKPINAFYKAYNEDPIKNQVIQNYLFMVTKGYTDFSKINNAATSKASREIDEVLKNSGGNFLENGAINYNVKDSQSTFTLGGEEIEFDID